MSQVAIPTKCRLCQKVFYAPTELVIGRGDDRLQRHLKQLSDHAQSHREQEGFIQLKLLEFIGYLRFGLFESKDEAVNRQRDFYRWQLNQETQRNQIGDPQIESTVERFIRMSIEPQMQDGYNHAGIKTEMVKLIKEMRTIMLETNRYPSNPVQAPAKSALV